MSFDELPMRIALGQANQLTDEIIAFAHQTGITDIQFNMFHGSPHLSGDSSWEYMDLVRLRTSCQVL